MARLFDRLLAGMNILASFWLVALMLIICADVAARMVSRPMFGVFEIAKFSIVGIVWLQMPYALRAGRHLRSDLLLNLMPRTGRRAINALNSLIGAAIFAMIAYLTSDDLVDSYVNGTFEGEPVRLLTWPFWLTLVLGTSAMAVEYVIQLFQSLFGASVPSDRESEIDGAAE